MEPVSALALMVAQFGVKRLVSALTGDDIGGLAAGMLGLLAQVEESQTRLIAIERQMEAMLEQHYLVSLRNGTRQLRQATMTERTASARRVDLDASATSLMDAAHAATTPTQAALAERLLLLAQVGRRDTPVARDAWQQLDLHVGDALAQGSRRYEQPGDETRKRLKDNEFGKLGALDQLRTFTQTDPRWASAYQTVRTEAGAAITELGHLLADTVSAAQLVDIELGVTPALTRPLIGQPAGPVYPTSHGCVLVDVPLGQPVHLAGVAATLHGVRSTQTATGDLLREVSADVAVDGGRQEPAMCWVAERAASPWSDDGRRPVMTVAEPVRPGTAASLVGRMYSQPSQRPERMTLALGGLVLSARLAD